MSFLDTFKASGEATLMAYEGERVLARMLATEISRLARRVSAWARRTFTASAKQAH